VLIHRDNSVISLSTPRCVLEHGQLHIDAEIHARKECEALSLSWADEVERMQKEGGREASTLVRACEHVQPLPIE